MNAIRRRIIRKTDATRYQSGRHAQIVIDIPPGGRTIGFRLHQGRKFFYLLTSDLLALAIDTYVKVERARRKAEKKERRDYLRAERKKKT